MNMINERFRGAMDYALFLHREQTRKSSPIPYASHLMTVCGLVMEHGADEDEAIAALLHDAVEDRGGLKTRDEILERFGQRVADIVMGCTDGIEDEQGKKSPWRERKEAYIAHVRDAEPSILLVSNADKLHNARCILKDLRYQGLTAFDRFTGKRDGTLWYYRSLADVFLARSPEQPAEHPGRYELSRELERVVLDMHRLADPGI